MSEKLVECVANYSEARRPNVVEEIKAAIKSVPDVILLDQHSDNDHNRTVLTFVGPPGQIEEAAFLSIMKAAELINLDEHQGEHPRIGATDVVPFVPISGVSMEECVGIAQKLGRRVGEELGIPVYLYEEAAARPERKNLEKIRKGEYELLKAEISETPDRNPDYGPKKLGTAGATVIGARPFLIAYNVYLTTDDVSIAKKVAKAVRHSSGGLRYVKALGMLVEGRAQVSMNLTNFQRTPVAGVVEMIRREANRYGVEILSCELVGLIPQQALVEAAQWYLQLDGFEPEQVLEYRLAAAKQEVSKKARNGPQTETRFLEALASSQPTPGGGSASAFSAAAAAALVAMVARVTIGKKKYAAVELEMRSVLQKAERLRVSLALDVERDAQAFNRVMDTYKMPKESPEQRTLRGKAIQEATLGAAQVPLDVAGKAVEVIELAKTVIAEGNLNAISDGATGAALARAALTGAGYNVRINTEALEGREAARALVFELAALETRASEIESQIRKTLEDRGGISLV